LAEPLYVPLPLQLSNAGSDVAGAVAEEQSKRPWKCRCGSSGRQVGYCKQRVFAGGQCAMAGGRRQTATSTAAVGNFALASDASLGMPGSALQPQYAAQCERSYTTCHTAFVMLHLSRTWPWPCP
jgi:hypothetical protein